MAETAHGTAAGGAADATWFRAGIIKDAGDDPDVTHGALIRATLRPGRAGAGVSFHGGEGVGVITKPGLPIPVGDPAINPVPRQMMRDAVAELANALKGPLDVEIEISVPGGGEIALKTWNPRLGIEGGISILGTTGVVRPFSCSAWIASIHRGIDVARANDLPHVMGSTGATSEGWGRKAYALPDIALIDMGDFVGGMLKYMRRHPVPNLSILGGFGKMVKLARPICIPPARRLILRRLPKWRHRSGLTARASSVPIRFSRCRRWRTPRSAGNLPPRWQRRRGTRRWHSSVMRRHMSKW